MNPKIKLVLKLVLYIVAIIAGILLSFNLAIFLAPFIIAFAIATLIEPLIGLFMKKLKLSRKISSIISLLIVLLVFGLLIVLLLTRLYREAVSLSQILPEKYLPELYRNTNSIIERISDIYLGLPIEVTKNIEGMVSNMAEAVPKVLKSFGEHVLNTAFSIPQAFVFVLITILSTFFMSSDRDRIYAFMKRNVHEKWVEKAISIKNDMFMALFGYVRAQLIMMSITFIELSTGFFIIGIRHFILLALVIAIIDAFPILGTGGVLIPWALYELLTGDFRMALSLIIIYVVVLVVRQLIEPKILSQQIGLHPLVTLVSMYTGLRIFSFAGLIVGPIIVLLLKNIISGIIKQKTLKEFIGEYMKKS